MTDLAIVEYDNPPVVETVLGVQFDSISNLTNAHLGLFWQSLGEEWQRLHETNLIPTEFERFNGGRWAKLGFQLKVSDNQACRLQIRNASNDRMIQVQQNRFHLNWLGKPNQPYPKYLTMRDEFQAKLDQFSSFLSEYHFPPMTPNVWEITYINHIPRGTVWTNAEDWSFCRLLGDVKLLDLKNLTSESFGGSWHFVIPDKRGRLHIDWQHGRREEPEVQELIRLNLTARGELKEDDSILDGLDAGHDAIVLTFKKIMSDAANRHWGLNDANDS